MSGEGATRLAARPGVKADPTSLRAFAEQGEAVRDRIERALDVVRVTLDTIAPLWRPRASTGEIVTEVERLLRALWENEKLVDSLRRELLLADSSTSLNTGDRVEAVSGSASPWIDPTSDSWVVNLIRLGTGSPASPEFLARAAADAPATIIDIATSLSELTPEEQGRLLAEDPEQFLANWNHAADSAWGSVVDLARVGVGATLTLAPGADRLLEHYTGHSYGGELNDQLLAAVHLLADDPDALAASTIGLEQLRNDPYGWFGGALPDLILEGLTAGGAAMLGARRLRLVGTVADSVDPLHAVGSGPRRFPDLDVQRAGEPEWGIPADLVSRRQAPFESPETWVEDLNANGMDEIGRDLNCIDCARATEANWRGDDAVAAPLSDADLTGVSADRLEEWTGGALRPADLAEVEARLAEMGPGSSAIVASLWDEGGAHAYNAVNDGGVVKWVDAQLGEVSPWPPPYAAKVDESIAIFIGPDGRPR